MPRRTRRTDDQTAAHRRTVRAQRRELAEALGHQDHGDTARRSFVTAAQN